MDVVDILLVGLLVYYVYKLIRGTAAISIFLGIIILYIVWAVVKALNMSLLSEIMGQVLGVGVIAIIVLFQQEIRKFLLSLGNNYILNNEKIKLFSKMFGNRNGAMELQALDEITQACRKMSETRTGALIVLAHTSSMEFVIETGDVIDAKMLSEKYNLPEEYVEKAIMEGEVSCPNCGSKNFFSYCEEMDKQYLK